MQAQHFRRRWSDRQRINILDPTERAYWCKFFGVEDGDLMCAVDKVGTHAEQVRQYLQRELTSDWTVHVGRNQRQGDPPVGHTVL